MDFAAVDRSQRLGALQRANQVRSARARLKRRIADGEVTAVAVILSPRWETESMPIGEVLASRRHWGRVQCRGFLAGLHMAETKTIGSMTVRQRIGAAAVLTRRQLGSRQRDRMSSSERATQAAPPTA
jgi:hypothetical protein